MSPENPLSHFAVKSKSFIVSATPVGTDEDAIIRVLAYRSTAQRQEIRTAYKTTIGRVGTGVLLRVGDRDVSGSVEGSRASPTRCLRESCVLKDESFVLFWFVYLF